MNRKPKLLPKPSWEVRFGPRCLGAAGQVAGQMLACGRLGRGSEGAGCPSDVLTDGQDADGDGRGEGKLLEREDPRGVSWTDRPGDGLAW